ncbi:MAG: efflux RND transporter periplasmic adaptor subunit [Zoogloeaceae bacterium]|jgi:HlyD family secretion protein|nr:efflux RND transporter periplasmic adaptor subunit [Zoogloeaceae bacterium]
MNTPNLLQNSLRGSKNFLASKRIRFSILFLALLLGGWAWYRSANAPSRSQNFVMEELNLGSLTVSVSTSGTLEPTRAVDVGSELSGTLATVLVQENDKVAKGQLLAQLDTAKLRDAVGRSEAAVISAQAKVAQMEATLAEARVNLRRLQEVARLSGGKVPAPIEIDSAEATVKRAEANLKSARSEVAQAEASLKTDQTNIRKATITSPVDGVVLTRKVQPGQTVAASMTAPILFNIAEDLTQMELHVNVDEADVANVAIGQKANFTVAAWNNRKFSAVVERVDLGSTLTDNVVTYTTVLSVANDDLALRPGMTASVEIFTAQRENVLLVPNTALRFNPRAFAGAGRNSAGGEGARGQQQQNQGFLAKLMPRASGRQQQAPRQRPENGGANGGRTQVWVLENNRPRPIPVKTGVSNGRYTEILEGELRPGMSVITDARGARS